MAAIDASTVLLSEEECVLLRQVAAEVSRAAQEFSKPVRQQVPRVTEIISGRIERLRAGISKPAVVPTVNLRVIG